MAWSHACPGSAFLEARGGSCLCSMIQNPPLCPTLLSTCHWSLPEISAISISKPRLGVPGVQFSFRLFSSDLEHVPFFLGYRRGLDSPLLRSLQPLLLFVSFSLIIALLRLEIQGSNLEIPQEVWGMPEHLELGLGLFLCPMTGRGCSPEAGWEKGTGRGLWPLVAFFKCCQNDSCSPNFCLRLSDTHQGQGCASA